MKALVLAGGLPQVALIEELKSRNIQTVLIDWNKNPVASQYADIFYQESTLDIDAVTNIAIKEKVDFIITVCTDQALHTVALVSEKLNLPCYIDFETAKNVTNKSFMKKVFIENNIPTANFQILKDSKNIKDLNLDFPLIVKPVDCNSSKGVKKVNNKNDLKMAIDDAISLSRNRTAIVEEFITGQEISIDVFVNNGVAHVLSECYVDKIKDENKFVIFRTRYPLKENDIIKNKIQKIAQTIANAFNIKNAPMLIQVLLNGDDIYVIEFSARTGGGIKYQFIKEMSSFDVVKAVVDLTLGKKITMNINKKTELFVNTYLYCKSGIYQKEDGFQSLKDNNVIKEYYIFKPQGTIFDSVTNSGDRIASFSITGENYKQLKEKYNIAKSQIKILDANENNILNKDLISDLP